jgi:predicted nuclease with TOPRIM domain
MFTLKSILTTIVVISGIFIQQATIAYPKASKESELNYLKSVIGTLYGQPSADLDSYLEEQYDSQTDSVQKMLGKGYELCDLIEMANEEGISGLSLMEQEVAELPEGVATKQGVSLEKEQMLMVYENTKNHLCPELN